MRSLKLKVQSFLLEKDTSNSNKNVFHTLKIYIGFFRNTKKKQFRRKLVL